MVALALAVLLMVLLFGALALAGPIPVAAAYVLTVLLLSLAGAMLMALVRLRAGPVPAAVGWRKSREGHFVSYASTPGPNHDMPLARLRTIISMALYWTGATDGLPGRRLASAVT